MFYTRSGFIRRKSYKSSARSDIRPQQAVREWTDRRPVVGRSDVVDDGQGHVERPPQSALHRGIPRPLAAGRTPRRQQRQGRRIRRRGDRRRRRDGVQRRRSETTHGVRGQRQAVVSVRRRAREQDVDCPYTRRR